jgi:diaminopimelate epimerase
MMTPVVYVKDVDTTYFEGSCASGTLAAAYAVGTIKDDGIHELTMQQPGGILNAKVIKKEGHIENIYLNGPITLSDVITIG